MSSCLSDGMRRSCCDLLLCFASSAGCSGLFHSIILSCLSDGMRLHVVISSFLCCLVLSVLFCSVLYSSRASVMACDAKLNFDDNAEWRQKDTFKFRDYTQEDTREVKIQVA